MGLAENIVIPSVKNFKLANETNPDVFSFYKTTAPTGGRATYRVRWLSRQSGGFIESIDALCLGISSIEGKICTQ